MIDKDLLDLLACPETKKDLELADAATVEKINEAIAAGKISNRSKEKVTESIEGGLFRVGDTSAVYPIRESIPILLVDELILIEGI